VEAFETFGFEPGYDVEVDPEFPGDGDWGCDVIGFLPDGRTASDVESRWGPPLVVRVQPASSGLWVAKFPAGGASGRLRGVFAAPDPGLLVGVSDGLAYVVDVESPGAGAVLVSHGVHQVVDCPDPPLILLVRWTDMLAVGVGGEAWRTPRLCLDSLTVRETGPRGIVCTCEETAGPLTLVLDPETGVRLGQI